MRHISKAFILIICLLFKIVSASADDLINKYQNKIQLAKNKLSSVVLDNFKNGNANKQVLNFEEVVTELRTFLESDRVNKYVGNNHTLREYLNLTKNHLLHISLSHEIDSFNSIKSMYPHELPFKHDGRYPGYPTLKVLNKVSEFLNIITADNIKENIDFKQLRTQYIEKFFNRSINSTQDTLIKNLNKHIGKNKLETGEEYIQRVIDNSKTDINLQNIVLEEIRKVYSRGERELVNSIGDNSENMFQLFSQRIKKYGSNAGFNEFIPLVRNVYHAILVSTNVEAALKEVPKLQLMRENNLKRLEKIIDKGHYGYRETIDEIVRSTEFLDIVERTVTPSEANPLHYAKRYEYYLYYVLDLAPNHITIPTSASLNTFDLLKVSGSSIGYAGVSFKNLWVDSYAQTPNEFFLHDLANHERRRYQFTRNYARRLGIDDSDINHFVSSINKFNQSDILPMIKKMKNKDLKTFSIKGSDQEFIEKFKSFVPGQKYFKKELKDFSNDINQGIKRSDLIEEYFKKINNKKRLFDMIIFEVVHEDALPPSSTLIKESIMRPPNLPMPRDFIDFRTDIAHHSMEPAGTTMSYIINKLNGSFYDTPQNRMNYVASKEYRSPKKIIEITYELIDNLGGYRNLGKLETLKRIIYLTITEDGFLSYLLDEFQRDLHPVQKSLINSLKYAESLEVASIIGKFQITEEFNYYIDMIKMKMSISNELNNNPDEKTEKEIIKKLNEIDNSQFENFESLQKKYRLMAEELNDNLYQEIKKESVKDRDSSIPKLNKLKDEIINNRKTLVDKIKHNNSISIINKIEQYTHELEDVDKSILKLRSDNFIETNIKEIELYWDKVDPVHINRERLIDKVAENMHNQGWRVKYQLEHGVKSRFKPIPLSAFKKFETPMNAKIRFEASGYYGFKINSMGVLEQDINTEYKLILPELNEIINKKLAKEYVDIIIETHKNNKKFDGQLVETLADKVHIIWMQHNIRKLNSAFNKLGHDSSKLKFDEILDIVSKLNYDDFEKMNVEEATSLRQFVPTTNLSGVYEQNNYAIIFEIIKEELKEGVINKTLTNHSHNWSKIKHHQIDRDHFVKSASKIMHDQVWLPGYKASNGDLPRYKIVPESIFLKDEEAVDAFKRLSGSGIIGLRINSEGLLEQNIGQPSKYIISELQDVLSLKVSQQYVDLVLEIHKEGKLLTKDLIMSMGEKIHILWMNNNMWQLSSAFKKMNLDIKQLNLEEILVTIRRMDKSQWLLMNDTEKEKLGHFVPTDKLPWQDHKRNVNILLSIIDNMKHNTQMAVFKNRCKKLVFGLF